MRALGDGERALGFLAAAEDACAPSETRPPEVRPVVVVVIDEHGYLGPRTRVLDAPQHAGALRLLVNRRVERVTGECEDDRDEMWPPVVIGGGETRDPRVGDPRPK